MNNIFLLKLITGEEVICRVKGSSELSDYLTSTQDILATDTILLEDAIGLVFHNGGLNRLPVMFGAKQASSVVLPVKNIQMIATEIIPDLEKKYIEWTTGLAIPTILAG